MDKFQIQPARLKEWLKAVRMNCMDSYSFGVVFAAGQVMSLLNEPKTTSKEAEEGFKGYGLTGYMAGAAASMVARFHIRGDEFRQYWNSKYDVTEEQSKGGTVNPAIVTINDGPSDAP